MAVSLVCFTVLCLADHFFHREAAKADPTSGEWLTHVMVFVASTGANLSIGLLFFDRYVALLVFSSFFFIKVVHEMIDECKWHQPRCGRTESFIHLGMLISAQIAPVAFFLFGWFYEFKGLEQMGAGWWVAVLFGIVGLTVFSFGEIQLFLNGVKHESR